MPKVTFILGNGFDLGVGLKTSYSDMYDSYVNKTSHSTTIFNFKHQLAIRKPYDKWSDFEMAMAEYAEVLSSEKELIECVRDFKQHMVEHLRAENEKITKLKYSSDFLDKLHRELYRSKISFYQGLTPNVVNQIESIIPSYKVDYNYITFNYTTVLERILFAKIDEHDPLHIHGTLDRDVVLGIDNIEQINTSFKLSKRGRRAFIKTEFNEQFDKSRVEKAKSIISESDVICTYGFSMGESDRVWINALIDWLTADENHHLVVYQYDKTEYKQYNYDEIMDVEDEKKEALIEKLGVADKNIEDQIHIPIGNDIFNFDFNLNDADKSVENAIKVGV